MIYLHRRSKKGIIAGIRRAKEAGNEDIVKDQKNNEKIKP